MSDSTKTDLTSKIEQQEHAMRLSALPEGAKGAGRTTTTLPALEAKKGLRDVVRLMVHPFTRMHRIPVFRRLWIYMAVMAAYTFVVHWIAGHGLSAQLMKEAGNVAALSAIFGLLLVFRTNSAYERWWEGRRLWGQLVNDSRNFALKIKAYVQIPVNEKILLGEQIVSFAYALKHQLRDARPRKDLPGIRPLHQIPHKYHLPAQVALSIYETVSSWHARGSINEMTLLILDPHLKALMDICGACERIKSSPLAISYRAFMRQGIAINLIVMPWYIISQVDYLIGIPLVLVASYFMIGLELIAEDIEDPFGLDGDDLPLDAICVNIQKSVSEIMSTENEMVEPSADSMEFDPLKYTKSLKAIRVDPLKEET